MNREQWLGSALALVRQHLNMTAGALVPETVRVSCGFAGSGGRRVLGACYVAEASADGYNEIFISPTEADPLRVLAVLVHEAVHATGIRGHKADFKKVATAAGLEGKMTATVASARLNETMQGWIDQLGVYPHATLNPADGKKKQSTRLVKCTCGSCGYTLRVTAKWLDFSGAPFCPTDSCRDEDDMPARMTVSETEEAE